jgi:hypothetical protein
MVDSFLEMDISEIAVLFLGFAFTVAFLSAWYWRIFKFASLPPRKARLEKYILGVLPLAACAAIFYILRFHASSDVVDAPLYILFYILIGFAWLYIGVGAMFLFFDLSWKDDILGRGNRAALIAFAGGFMGICAIYSGANIGDGPGWWCVFFAGGLGLLAFFGLGMLLNAWTSASERITVDRDLGCGIRFGSYLLSSGIILARASAGDWTSFSATVIEFMDGYPVLFLVLLAMMIEWSYKQRSKDDAEDSQSGWSSLQRNEGHRNEGDKKDSMFGSMTIGTIYLLVAVLSIMLLPPLPINPLP